VKEIRKFMRLKSEFLNIGMSISKQLKVQGNFLKLPKKKKKFRHYKEAAKLSVISFSNGIQG
jgi:hypothetical protein